MFKQDPLCRSKLKCKLTGDTINKSEEHIWKHINGKRFLNKLEQKEIEKLSNGALEEEGMHKAQRVSKPSTNGEKEEGRRRKKDKGVKEIISEVRTSTNEDSDSEEAEFWMPQVGDCWDFDDGRDRWDSGLESELESDEGNGIDAAEGSKESEELSVRTKRMSIEIGPSSFASRKKKIKLNHPI